jgi:hypothetical protein
VLDLTPKLYCANDFPVPSVQWMREVSMPAGVLWDPSGSAPVGELLGSPWGLGHAANSPCIYHQVRSLITEHILYHATISIDHQAYLRPSHMDTRLIQIIKHEESTDR